MAGMRQETAIDGFRLTYERTGAGPAVLLLHGWPRDRSDYRAVVPLVSPAADVIVPDLRGFGESDKHAADPARPPGRLDFPGPGRSWRPTSSGRRWCRR
jgi:pimeloyl-ACP methyl ester carboxylesterase